MHFEVGKDVAELSEYLRLDRADIQPSGDDVQWREKLVQQREDYVQQREERVQRAEVDIRRREYTVQWRDEYVQRKEEHVQQMETRVQQMAEDIRRREDDAQREMRDMIKDIHKTQKIDRPPRLFILVPHVGKSSVMNAARNLNPIHKTFDMYFICQSLIVELKNAVEGDSAARSSDYRSEFSEPMCVKQPTAFMKNHKHALSYGMAVLRICVVAAASAVALGSIVPPLDLANYGDLVSHLERFANLDVTDSDELNGSRGGQPSEELSAALAEMEELDDAAYEGLRAFLKKHHDDEWKIAVNKTLKVVSQRGKSVYVCRANESHETKWMELKHSHGVNRQGIPE